VISLDLALSFFLLLAVLNYRAQRSVLYPPFIFCALWLLVLTVIRLDLLEFDALHDNTLAIVSAGAVSFSFGGLLASITPRGLLRIHIARLKPKRTPDFLHNTLIMLLLCGLPVMFYQTWRLSNSQGSSFNLMQARAGLMESIYSGEKAPFRVVGYFTLITTLASFLFGTGKKDRQFWIVTVIAFIVCILNTGRASLLQFISGLSAIHLLQSKQESLRGAMRLLRWPIALIVTLFIGLIFTNKNTEEMPGGVTGIATYFVVGYIIGPLGAFDKVVQNPAHFMSAGNYTFYFPLHMADRLHLIDYSTSPIIEDISYVPFPTNVYTLYERYFLELGLIGTLVLMFLVGLLHSLLYLKAKQGGRFSIYLFAFSMYSVLMVTFVDAYDAIPTYLFAITYGLLYFLIGSVSLCLFRRTSMGTSLRE
jgi:oligosaccharide repeat unit polymerase